LARTYRFVLRVNREVQQKQRRTAGDVPWGILLRYALSQISESQLPLELIYAIEEEMMMAAQRRLGVWTSVLLDEEEVKRLEALRQHVRVQGRHPSRAAVARGLVRWLSRGR